MSIVRYWPLLCLAVLHTVVDSYSMLTEPLWPAFKTEFHLNPRQLELLLSISLLTVNFSQALFGFLRDRYRITFLLWLGPIVGVLCLPMVGIAGDAQLAAAALCLGMVGIGAFHPEAAVTAATSVPEHRTRGISLFMFGGTLGLAIGPTLGGWMVQSFGLRSLPYLVLPGIVLIAILQALPRLGQSGRAAVTVARPRPALQISAAKFRLVAFVLAVCALRVVPNVGMTKAIAFTLDAQGVETGRIGLIQSVFLVSGSLGLLLMATHFHTGWERACMIWCPLIGVPLLLGLWFAAPGSAAMLVLLALSGIVFNGTTPAMVAYGHQLFPESAGFASALTMGVSWGFAGLLIARFTSMFDSLGHPEWLFLAFVPCLILSAGGACFLPAYQALREPEKSAELEPA